MKDQPIYRAAQACRADVPLSADLRDFGPFMNHQRRNRPTHYPAGDLSSGPSAPATQALLLRIYTTPGYASFAISCRLRHRITTNAIGFLHKLIHQIK